MGFFNKFNKGERVFDIDLAEVPFITLAELAREKGTKAIHKVVALYVNDKGLYKPHPIAVCIIDGGEIVQVDLPEHLTETVEDIIEDDTAVNLIKSGKCGIIARSYTTDKYPNKTFYSALFVDIE